MELPDQSFDLIEQVETSTLEETALVPEQSTSSSIFECDICWYTTYKKYNYTRHLKSHMKDDDLSRLENTPSTSTPKKDIKDNICDQCGKSFKSSFGLQLHTKNKHLQEYAHVCSVCGKGYNQKVQFKFHVASHINISLIECSFCKKTLKGHSSLARHKLVCQSNPARTETDENNNFICEICFKNFKTNDRLNYHKKGKHGPKKYSCQKCGNKYSWRSSLKVHRMNCK